MAITNIIATTSGGVNNVSGKNTITSALSFTPLVALDATNDADIYTATYATHGVSIPMGKSDSKVVLLIRNVGSSANAAIKVLKAADNPVRGADIALTITKSTGGTNAGDVANSPVFAIEIESARYKNLTGIRAGYVNIVGATVNVEVAVINLS